MKYAKYLVGALLLCAAVACKKDPGEVKPVGEYRNAFLASTEIGLYQDGRTVVAFNKSNHQLGMSLQKPLFRITDNAGVQFAELTLNVIPSGEQSANGTLTVAGYNAAATSASDFKVLKQEDNLVWLWSDQAATGMIMPLIEF